MIRRFDKFIRKSLQRAPRAHQYFTKRLNYDVLEERRLLAVRALAGFADQALPRNDDNSTQAVAIGFQLNFFGNNYSQLFVNNNGNVTFDEALEDWSPDALATIEAPIIAPFWADVDTRGTSSGLVTYGTATVDNRPAFGVNWNHVGYFESNDDKLNTFQLVLIDRSDVQMGAFDIEFNYDNIVWETGDDGGNGGLGGASARAGFSNGTASPGTHYELIGSGINGAFLDSSAHGLKRDSLRSQEAGRYVFPVRSGTALNVLGLVGQAIQIAPNIVYLGAGIHPYEISSEAPNNQVSVDTSDADRVTPGGGLDLNLTGAGVTVGVIEANSRVSFTPGGGAGDPSPFVRGTHNDLTGRVTHPGSTPGSFGRHATHVAATIAGDGTSDPNAQGFAPGALIQSFGITGSFGITAANAANVDITNHSYGSSNIGWGDAIDEADISAASLQNSAGGDLNGDGDTDDQIDAWYGDRSLDREDHRFGVYSAQSAAVDAFLANPARRTLLSVQSAGNDRNNNFFDTLGTNQYLAYFSAGLMSMGAGWYIVPATGDPATNSPDSDGNDGDGSDSIVHGNTAKNRLIVGAIVDLADVESSDLTYRDLFGAVGTILTDFSSFGPLDDGRLGVHVVANGDGLLSADASGDDATFSDSGTSMSAPSVTGVAALMLEHYRSLANQAGTALPNAAPSSATQKAILMHTTEDLLTPGPDYQTGYGLVQADAAIEFITSADGRGTAPDRTDRVIEDTFTAGEAARVFTIQAQAGQELRATLAWIDPAGTGQAVAGGGFANPTPTVPLDSATRALVNDLDITVTAPDGTIFRPWVLNRATPYSAATTGRNNLDNVEQVLLKAPASGAYTITIGTVDGMLTSGASQQFSLLLSADGDRLEDNDSIATATVLGSLPEITLRNLSIDSADDVDFFRVTANQTGKLIVNTLFTHANGDLELRVADANGNEIAVSTSAGDNEQIIIPVVAQQVYFVQVFGFDGATNEYSLEIENFAAPVPNQVDLVTSDDTGVSNVDNNTSDTTPAFTIFVDLQNFIDPDGDGSDDIALLTAAEAAAGDTPGVAVQLFINGVSVGFADSLFGSVAFQRQIVAAMANGQAIVQAAVRVFDGQTPTVTGRQGLSEPLLVTIDTVVPSTTAPDLLASSDSGTSSTDNVTKVASPTFVGIGEANSKVRIFANGLLVGQGVVGSDSTDGVANNGVGAWQVSAGQLADGQYSITYVLEDLAGNISEPSIPLTIWVDTALPNQPHLDVVEASDLGRNNQDNVTRDSTPTVDITISDTPGGGANPFPNDVRVRVYDRPGSAGEVLVYDSFVENSGLITAGFLRKTLSSVLNDPNGSPLSDGVHNLKLEVEDRAGNISHAFLLEVTIDTQAPTVSFGIPGDATDGLHPSSDTGVLVQPNLSVDRITSDSTPRFWGRAEANSMIRAFVVVSDNNTPGDLTDDTLLEIGRAVAIPNDGDDGLADGSWQLTSTIDLNDPGISAALTADGLRSIRITAEDVAGNVSTQRNLDIFIDSSGPQIEDVFASFAPAYQLFGPIAAFDGPTPLINSIDIVFLDAPVRGPGGQFVYPAVNTLVAETIGNYELIGDHTGRALITQAEVVSTSYDADGVRTTVRLTLNSYLPDDRFTLKVSDNIVDDAGNRLDGDTQATAPFEEALQQLLLFPSGDGQPGGPFAARFTVDSRPEIGSYAGARVNVDINGNFVWDLEGQDNDSTNRDLQFTLGVVPGFGVASMGIHDAVFNGDFHSPGLAASGFDKLAAYGFDETANAFRWLIDVNHDGIVDPLNGDVVSIQPFGYQINGIPFAGNWDPTTEGDEIGLYDGDYFYLDRDGNNVINGNDLPRIPAAANFRGLPLAGDFDGNGSDDLAVWKTDVFSFSFAPTGGLPNGTPETTIAWGYPGVAEKPVAADMDQDGIDDIGLIVPGANGHDSAWYFLISNDFAGLKRVTGTVNTLDHQFSPAPLGQDLSARFGGATELPLVGNFDPPVTSGASEASLGVVHSSKELSIPSLSGARSFGFQTTRPGALVIDLGVASAATGLTVQVYDESMTLIVSGIADSQGKVHLEAARPGVTNGTIRVVGTASDVSIKLQNQVAEDDLLDVNRDGFVSAIDLVTLVSSLNSSGLQSLTKSDIGQAGVFLDTNQDGYISAIDLLTVAERLNRQPSSTHALATSSTESGSAILSSEDATDLAIASSLPTPTPDSDSAPVTAVQPPTATATDVAMSDAFEFSTEMKEKLAGYPYSSVEASETHTFLFTLDFDWL